MKLHHIESSPTIDGREFERGASGATLAHRCSGNELPAPDTSDSN
jgi:hypothetical protein